MSTIAKFLSFIILISFSASSQILQKKGVLNLDLADLKFSVSSLFLLILSALHNYWLLGGVFLMGLTFILYLLILSRTHLGSLYPVFASGTIIFVAIASQPLFNEILSLPQILGISIIISGIFLMFFKKSVQKSF